MKGEIKNTVSPVQKKKRKKKKKGGQSEATGSGRHVVEID